MHHLTKTGFLASWELAQGGQRNLSLLRSFEHLVEKPASLAPVGTSHTKLVLSLAVVRGSRAGSTSSASQILIDHEAVDLTGCQDPDPWVNTHPFNGGRIMSNPLMVGVDVHRKTNTFCLMDGSDALQQHCPPGDYRGFCFKCGGHSLASLG